MKDGLQTDRAVDGHDAQRTAEQAGQMGFVNEVDTLRDLEALRQREYLCAGLPVAPAHGMLLDHEVNMGRRMRGE